MARPDTDELCEALEIARDIAREAAAIVLSGWRTPMAIQKKGEVDLVTEHDLRSEELVRERLSRAFPDHAIVGEEGEHAAAKELTWYVDPLDGTTNFVHGHPFFCVSIGLCHEGEPVLGAIAAPALRTEWLAARGLGATRDAKPCRVTQTHALHDALAATGFPYDVRTSDVNNFSEFEALYRRTRGIRRCGAAAIDLAMVADGTYDFYWEYKLNAWDACAGALAVEEAGGRVTDVTGAALRPPRGVVVATNGPLHEEVLAALAQARSGPSGQTDAF